jgi:hypothetical protein
VAPDADRLNPAASTARLSKLDWQGKLLAGDPPSKESFLHRDVPGATVERRGRASPLDALGRGIDPGDRSARCRR